MNWILIVAMFSPAGDYMDKYTLGPMSEKQCIQEKSRLSERVIMGVSRKGICVTEAHWNGTKPMPNVAHD